MADSKPPADVQCEEWELMYPHLRAMSRYSGYWCAASKNVAELNVVETLAQTLEARGEQAFFVSPQSREPGFDPPDVEALTLDGHKLAIEVTELVHGPTIEASRLHPRTGEPHMRHAHTVWSKSSFLQALQRLLGAKATRRRKLKGGPYDGGYVVVVCTDDWLNPATIRDHLDNQRFTELQDVDRCFLILSPEPGQRGHPLFELLPP